MATAARRTGGILLSVLADSRMRLPLITKTSVAANSIGNACRSPCFDPSISSIPKLRGFLACNVDSCEPRSYHLLAGRRRIFSPTLSSALPASAASKAPTNASFTNVGHGSGGRAAGIQVRMPLELPFSILGLNHIAIAVPDLDGAAEHFRTVFGAQVSQPLDLPEHGVTVVIVHISNTTIELLHPLGENSTIQGFLAKNPRGGLHHLCFTVNDVHAAAAHAEAEGVHVLGDGKPKLGAHNNPVIFLNPKSNVGVLCEFEQVHCAEKEDLIS